MPGMCFLVERASGHRRPLGSGAKRAPYPRASRLSGALVGGVVRRGGYRARGLVVHLDVFDFAAQELQGGADRGVAANPALGALLVGGALLGVLLGDADEARA